MVAEQTGAGATLPGRLADPHPRSTTAAQQTPADLEHLFYSVEDDLERLEAVLGTLPERLRFIQGNRYGLHGLRRMTLAQVGERLDLSAERVRQQQLRAMELLSRRIAKATRINKART